MVAENEDIVREIRIDAPPEEVFPYFTDAKKMVSWKAVRAELDPRARRHLPDRRDRPGRRAGRVPRDRPSPARCVHVGMGGR